MAEIYDFNSTFFLSLATMVFGFFGVALGYALKSKCSNVKICGCIEITRDIEAELEEDRMNGVPALPNQPQPQQPSDIATPVISRRDSRSAVSSAVSSRVNSRRPSRSIEQSVVDFTESMKN